MRSRLNNGASATRRTREIVARDCVEIRKDPSNLFLRISGATGKISRLTVARPIRTGDRYVSNGVATILIVLRYAILCGELTKVIYVQFFSYARGLGFHAVMLRLYHARVLRSKGVHPAPRALARHLNRNGTATCRRRVGVLKEALRRGVACVSASCMAFRSRFVDHFKCPLRCVVAGVLLRFFYHRVCRGWYTGMVGARVYW